MNKSEKELELQENRLTASIAQAIYCKQNKLPHFAPEDGRCYSCGHNIYDTITAERAAKELITGCPKCHYSYCD